MNKEGRANEALKPMPTRTWLGDVDVGDEIHIDGKRIRLSIQHKAGRRARVRLDIDEGIIVTKAVRQLH